MRVKVKVPDRYLSPEEVKDWTYRCEMFQQELQDAGQTVLVVAHLLEEDGVTTALVGCLKDSLANDLAVYLLTKGQSAKSVSLQERIELAKTAKTLYERLTQEVIDA